MKSVFIALITSERHKKFIHDYLIQIVEFSKACDNPLTLGVVETTPNNKEFNKFLANEMSLVLDNTRVKYILNRYDWNPEEEVVFNMIGNSKNVLRDIFLKGDYDLYFSLDSDTFLPPYSINYLIEADKDNVGFPSPIWGNEPCVFKTGGGHYKIVPYRNMKGEYVLNDNNEIITLPTWMMDAYNWYELIVMCREKGTYLHKVHAVGNGCLMTKRKVFEKIKWEVPKNFIIGEDAIWYENVANANFEAWVDMRTIPIHKFVGWKGVPTWTKHRDQKTFVIFGQANDEDYQKAISDIKILKKGIKKKL